MSDGNKKTMTPELLPDPKRARGTALGPRERVQRHMNELKRFGVAAGTAVVATFGYACLDPAPSPMVWPAFDPHMELEGYASLYEDGTVWVVLDVKARPQRKVELPRQIHGAPEDQFLYLDSASLRGASELTDETTRLANTFTFNPLEGASRIEFDLLDDCHLPAVHVIVHLVENPWLSRAGPDAGVPDSGSSDASDAGADASQDSGTAPATDRVPLQLELFQIP